MSTIVTETTTEQVNTDSERNASPVLTCVITGNSRPTNENYLRSKAEKREVSIEHFLSFYASKQAVKRLRAGMSVDQVRVELGVKDPDKARPIDEDQLKEILRINGKIKKI